MKIHLANGFRLQYEEAQQATILLFPEGLVQLNGPSEEILKLCNGHHSEDELIDVLQKKFPGDDIAQDVKEFLAVALDKGWIRVK